jgi:hypothetical protein
MEIMTAHTPALEIRCSFEAASIEMPRPLREPLSARIFETTRCVLASKLAAGKVKCPAWREANRNRGELFGEARDR